MIRLSHLKHYFVFGLLNILITFYPNPSANNSYIEKVVLIENAEIQVSIASEEDLAFFKKAEYDVLRQELNFSTTESTVQIRIYDELESMMYLLPVESSKIKIGKNLFDSGSYRIIFDVEGDRRMYATQLEVFS